MAPRALAEAGELCAVVRARAELTIVCPKEAVPDGVRAERGGRALEVAGPLHLSLTGVLAALTAPLANAGVPVFALATYDTDYLLVPESRLPDAVAGSSAPGTASATASDPPAPPARAPLGRSSMMSLRPHDRLPAAAARA